MSISKATLPHWHWPAAVPVAFASFAIRASSRLVIARSTCDDAIQFFLRFYGLLRCARNDAGFSHPLQLVVNRIVGIADFLAAIEGCAVVGRQRKSVAEAARQVRIGNEDA